MSENFTISGTVLIKSSVNITVLKTITIQIQERLPDTSTGNLGGPPRRTGYKSASQRRGRHPEALYRRSASCIAEALSQSVIKKSGYGRFCNTSVKKGKWCIM